MTIRFRSKRLFWSIRAMTLVPIILALLGCGGGGGGSGAPSGAAGSADPPSLSKAPLMGGAVQAKALSLSMSVSTIAGPLPGFDGTGLEAVFRVPYAVVTDGTNLYVADSWNQTIRKIVIATRTVTTLAGTLGLAGATDGTGASARFNYPSGITSDGTWLFVTDQNSSTIRKIEIATGIVTTLCGSPGMWGSADGVGAAARFQLPYGIATDGANLYVADYGNSTIRKVVIATGAVTTLAGSAGVTGSADGIGAAARFKNPQGITTDGVNLFVADTNNSTIRKVVIATGAVTTLAGSAGVTGSADGIGAAATFWYPTGITALGPNLYIADPSNNTIRMIDKTTAGVTTFCGSAMSFGTADGYGTAAKFEAPAGIATDGANLYVADSGGGKIRQVVIATTMVTTLAGNPANGLTDGTGAEARFDLPYGVTTDGINLFVADARNNAIRKIDISTGMVTTLAGGGISGSTDGIGTVARFNWPNGITTDGSNLYVADQDNSTIRMIVIATGMVTTLAGSPGITGSSDGTGTAVSFNRPAGITTDGTNLYVADAQNGIIRKIVIATGAVTTIAGAAFGWLEGITTDGANLYVTDDGNQVIGKIVIATGMVTTLAGSPGVTGSSDGTGTAAAFSSPAGITTDGTNLYVADFGNHTIRQIAIATGEVTTIAGSAGTADFKDGIGHAARFSSPQGITTDGASLYVADRDNTSIRRIR